MLEESIACKDQILYKHGQPVDGMYLVKEGEVSYHTRIDAYKPENITTKSWCRATLLSQDNETAKR